ncbi:hypothetical protein KC352_g2 [Hortaea werneckii]|nr:hypothetical protein KC352_g2 [Hortaea werneckii]
MRSFTDIMKPDPDFVPTYHGIWLLKLTYPGLCDCTTHQAKPEQLNNPVYLHARFTLRSGHHPSTPHLLLSLFCSSHSCHV